MTKIQVEVRLSYWDNFEGRYIWQDDDSEGCIACSFEGATVYMSDLPWGDYLVESWVDETPPAGYGPVYPTTYQWATVTLP